MSDNPAPGKYDLARKLFAILSEEGGMASVRLSGFSRQFVVRIGTYSIIESRKSNGIWEAHTISPAQLESVEPYREPWTASFVLPASELTLGEIALKLCGAPKGSNIRCELTEVT